MRGDLSRRKFLATAGAAVAGFGAGPIAKPLNNLANYSMSGAFAPGSGALKDHAASKGFLYGADARQYLLSHNPAIAQLYIQQCAILVPDGELKWGQLRPSPDTYNFAPADWLLNFTQQNNMKLRGHTFVWYQRLPKWFDGYVTSANAKQVLTDHINTVMGRYAGKLQSWDIVNEVMNPKDNRPDGLRNSPWLRWLGPDYIEYAFRTAAAADPHTQLIWNENWLEEETPEGESKRRAMVKLLKEMKSRGVPINGIGIQSHLIGGHADIIAGEGFQRFLHEVSDLDYKILITELDISDQDLPTDPGARDQIIANLYYKYLSTVLSHKSVEAVLTWGLTDKDTWLTDFKPRTDGTPVRPLPFDAALNPKPVYDAMVRAFDEAPKR